MNTRSLKQAKAVNSEQAITSIITHVEQELSENQAVKEL